MRLPVKAQYEVVDGEAVQVSAEYAEVDDELLAAYLWRHFEAWKQEKGDQDE